MTRPGLDEVGERVPVDLRHGGAGELGQRRGEVDDPRGAGQDAAGGHAGAGEHERRPGLPGVERSVLAEVAAAGRPVVTRGGDDDDVGCAVGVGEGRRQPWAGERVGVALVRR